MRKAGFGLFWLLIMSQRVAFAGGVTPYLPINLAPEIQAQVERVLIRR
jgi:hypothetical protein